MLEACLFSVVAMQSKNSRIYLVYKEIKSFPRLPTPTPRITDENQNRKGERSPEQRWQLEEQFR